MGHCEVRAGRVPINDTKSSMLEKSSDRVLAERLF